MSRVAKSPISIPAGIEVNLAGKTLKLKGAKGSFEYHLHEFVNVVVKKEDKLLVFSPQENVENADALAGTARALVKNILLGLSKGFERKLTLLGVGFRAQVQGKVLNLTIGFSHPVKYDIPQGITIETPSQTEIVIKGFDKQLVGQVAAQIRDFRPPEPYKGKGIRYDGEVIVLKEGKKK